MTHTGQTAEYYWNYDFYYKDHLGNIRATVTEQQDQSQYKVSTEAALQTEELSYSYYNPAHTRTRSQIPGYTDTTKANNRVVRTLTYQSQRAFAYQTVLKVMAGDRLDLKVDYFYKPNETATDLGTPEQDWWYWGFHGLLNQMFSQLGAAVNSSHFTATQLQANGMAAYNAGIVNLLNTRNASPLVDPAKPKAYLNWVFIDDAFRQLDGDAGQGWMQVGAGVTDFAPLVQANIKVPKSGYVYIWVSNDSEVPVYFDDLAINHRAGPLLQEDDYYPFGLEMKMLGSKAAGKAQNKKGFNGGNEMQNGEFADGSGLDWYDANNRMFDPQTGRFNQIDPLADLSVSWSTYTFCSNNPINRNDPLGLKDTLINGNVFHELQNVVVSAVKKAAASIRNDDNTQSWFGREWRMWASHFTGVGTQANNLWELGVNSMLRRNMVWLGGGLLDKVKSDGKMKRHQAKILAIIKADPRYKKLQFVYSDAGESVEFGGTRAAGEDWGGLSNENPLLHSETWDVAMNPLTWTLRHANVQTDAIVKGDGTIVLNHYVSDKLDLRPGDGHTKAYNDVTTVLGAVYHDILRATDNLQVRASWSVTINK